MMWIFSYLQLKTSLRDFNTSYTLCELAFSWCQTSLHLTHVVKLSIVGFYGLSSRTQARNLWYWGSRVFNTLKANWAICKRNKRGGGSETMILNSSKISLLYDLYVNYKIYFLCCDVVKLEQIVQGFFLNDHQLCIDKKNKSYFFFLFTLVNSLFRNGCLVFLLLWSRQAKPPSRLLISLPGWFSSSITVV